MRSRGPVSRTPESPADEESIRPYTVGPSLTISRVQKPEPDSGYPTRYTEAGLTTAD
jgi:hypothetical protein